MTIDLTGRNFLKELDFTPEEWKHLLSLAAELKAAKVAREATRRVIDKLIVSPPSSALARNRTLDALRCTSTHQSLHPRVVALGVEVAGIT